MQTIKTLTVAGLLIAATPALAQMSADEVVAELEKNGYTNIEVRQTILGRTKIEAVKNGIEREIVVTKNGKILRDEIDDDHDDDSSDDSTDDHYDDDSSYDDDHDDDNDDHDDDHDDDDERDDDDDKDDDRDDKDDDHDDDDDDDDSDDDDD